MDSPLILDALNAIRNEISTGLSQVDRQIDGVNKRIDEINVHLSRQEERIRSTEASLTQIKTVWSIGVIMLTLALDYFIRKLLI